MKSFSNEENFEICKTLFFELIERISRFYLHFDEIQTHFYSSNKDRSVYDGVNLLTPYYDCLKNILFCGVNISKPIFSEKYELENEAVATTIDSIQQLIGLLHELHEKLGIIPRPTEPAELKRFGRILSKHSMNLVQTKISIYVDENVTEETYATDPLAHFKQYSIDTTITEILKNLPFKVPIISKDSISTSGFHITIPRIDASNSCRWPTLVHELAHKLGDNRFFKNEDILINFKSAVSSTNIDLDAIKLDGEFCLESWLKECWCDLFGAIVMGPSFWFSQASAFIFSHSKSDFGSINCTHPPPLFRLLLITNVLRHRFKDAMYPECEQGINTFRKLFDHFDELNESGFLNNAEMRQLFNLFKIFFIDHFFIKTDGKLSLTHMELNPYLDSLIKYSSSLERTIIEKMVKMLNEGIPISSYREPLSDDFMERPSHVQEVLFAAWLYRVNGLKNNILKEISVFVNNDDFSEEDVWNFFCENVVKQFSQFNYSVLRSIQVGEWFDLLQQSSPTNQNLLNVLRDIESIPSSTDHSKGILVDKEILRLLAKEEIIVSPIINLSKQLGSTSLDLRLGTSFQVYYPNQAGILDLNDPTSISQANRSSNLVDLDFCEYIILVPGQFILAHSMEYIILPDYISAELDGRSSFARLGVEIHMTAGFIDPGFQGVLTYEIYNAGPNPIKLYPGLRIGQLRFMYGDAPAASYRRQPTAKYRGLLQHHNSLQSNDYEIGLFKQEQ